MANITLKEKFEVFIPADTVEFIKKFKEMEARMKVIDADIKEKAKEFLEQNNLIDEGYEQDGIKLTYCKPYKKTILDINKLKEEGVYDEYSYEKEYDGYVKYAVKYDEEE